MNVWISCNPLLLMAIVHSEPNRPKNSSKLYKNVPVEVNWKWFCRSFKFMAFWGPRVKLVFHLQPHCSFINALSWLSSQSDCVHFLIPSLFKKQKIESTFYRAIHRLQNKTSLTFPPFHHNVNTSLFDRIQLKVRKNVKMPFLVAHVHSFLSTFHNGRRLDIEQKRVQ